MTNLESIPLNDLLQQEMIVFSGLRADYNAIQADISRGQH